MFHHEFSILFCSFTGELNLSGEGIGSSCSLPSAVASAMSCTCWSTKKFRRHSSSSSFGAKREALQSTGAGRGLSATWLGVVCDLNSFFFFPHFLRVFARSVVTPWIVFSTPNRFAATSCASCGACGGTQKILRFWRGALSRHGFPAENWCIWWAVGHPFVIPFWGGHFPASISGKRHRGSTSCRAALVTTCRGRIPGLWSSDVFCKDSCRITSIICHIPQYAIIMADDHVVLRSMVMVIFSLLAT